MSSCPQCHIAQTRENTIYTDGCVGCQIRKLVHMDGPQREAMLGRIRFAAGEGARAEAMRLIEIERARIKQLRAKAPGKETANGLG